MKIGVFDSGAGGLSVAKVVEQAMPDLQVVFRNDAKHVPYGTRPAMEVFRFVVPILEELVADGCEVIIIACNTVSTTLITSLRNVVSVPLIAMEPMVKPAAQLTTSGIIAVCATPATLASERFQWLKATYAKNIEVLEPDCSDWVTMIEHGQLEIMVVQQRIEAVLDAGADVIVLGCTHFHWIQAEIEAMSAGRAKIIQPEQAIVARLRQVLTELPTAR